MRVDFRTAMSNLSLTLLPLVLLPSLTPALAQDCQQENGNYYCSSVSAIAYSNFGTPGTYNRVTSMNAGKTCDSRQQIYGGGMAPLDKEVSWHFRGPMHIKQFAYYTLGGSGVKTKREENFHDAAVNTAIEAQANANNHQRRAVRKRNFHDEAVDAAIEADKVETRSEDRHAHQHYRFHEKYADMEKRAYGDEVVATMNGKTWTMTDTWSKPSAAPVAPANPAPAAAQPAQPPQGGANSGSNRVDNNPPSPQNQDQNTINNDNTSAPSSPTPQINPGAGNWGRQTYFNAATSESSGLVFLNNKGGGSCSGTFDYDFGNSLSYASADGKTCASTPQTLSNGWIDDGDEISLFTDASCDRGSCGFVREKSVAHHGFSGQSKLFLLEFDMPLAGTQGWNKDMPAAWILNAEIPRSTQYADPNTCSCWESGCGEWDIFEVLDSGNGKCKSTWHGKNSIGDSNWFQRPTGGSRKAMVLMDGESGTGTISFLDDAVEFGSVVSVEQVNRYVSAAGNVVQTRLPG